MASAIFETWRKWVYNNNIAQTAAAFTIGVSTAELIRSVVNGMFRAEGFGVVETMRSLTVWFATVFATFLIMEFGFNRALAGTKSTEILDPEESRKFEESKVTTPLPGFSGSVPAPANEFAD